MHLTPILCPRFMIPAGEIAADEEKSVRMNTTRVDKPRPWEMAPMNVCCILIQKSPMEQLSRVKDLPVPGPGSLQALEA